MVRLIEAFIRKTKNDRFKFDEGVGTLLILSFALDKFMCWIRGGLARLFYQLESQRLFLDKGVKFFNSRKMKFGTNVSIGRSVKISALGTEGISLGDNVSIGDFSSVVVSTSFNHVGKGIQIGSNVGMGEFSYLGGAGGLVIGSDTIIGQYFSTHPENHIFSESNTLIRNQGVSREGIDIGKNCWIGSKVTILDGVTIGENTVIAAGSVVTESFPSHVVLGGVPARILKRIDSV